MSWRLSGTYFENCNCAVLCPCGASYLALPADNERCQNTFVFHVDSGEIDGVDVSGLSSALVLDAPGRMVDGGWRVGLVMDAAASPQQAEALAAFISGARGPMAVFAPLIGEMLGTVTAPITYHSEGRRHSAVIGGLVDIEIEDFVAEGQSLPIQLTNLPHPANSTITVAQATRSRTTAFGMTFDNTGKNGHAAPFSWEGE